MSKIVIAGLVNMETTVKVGEFPIAYCPIHYPFYGVNSCPAGAAFNVSLALKKLGDEAVLLSFLGDDSLAGLITAHLGRHGIEDRYLLKQLDESPQSVILYDDAGRRQIYCDLKETQDMHYPVALFEEAAQQADLLCICNSNFNRGLLETARKQGKIIATDVQVLGDIKDAYNAEFMQYADILFLSGENIRGDVKEFVLGLAGEYNNSIIVVGLGRKGALLYVREDADICCYPAVYTREVVNTVGAGDSLFAAFVHYYGKKRNPREALEKAMVFASYKIGEKGAAMGFLSELELENECRSAAPLEGEAVWNGQN